MERMYQRNKIQEESLYYESLKHSGELPIVGVNTFLNKKGSLDSIARRSHSQYNSGKRTADQKCSRFLEKRNENYSAEALKTSTCCC